MTRSVLRACDTEVAQLEEVWVESEVQKEIEPSCLIKPEGG